MIKPITSAEFRENMKSFLDAAQTKDIYIGRRWEVYKLTYIGNSFGELTEETREKLKTQPPREPLAKALAIPGVVKAADVEGAPIKCKGTHFMDRTNCGKLGCPW